MKLGTIGVLIVGILFLNPEIRFPAVSQFTNGGPVVPFGIFPFVFITIACGAISGFHGLIGSGTTPKMVNKETDARFIGYGAMLCEAIVGLVALIAACSLEPGDYFAMNVKDPNKFSALGLSMQHLPELSRLIGETLKGRTGGAASLAVGIGEIFRALPGFGTLLAYWYHFAIMFEALFVLTTVDSGTRVARFLVQEFAGRWSATLGQTKSIPGALFATILVCGGWGYLVWTGSVLTLWPMLGISNQLLACIALCTATTMIVNAGRGRFAWVTLLPFTFVATATQTAGYELITRTFFPTMIHGGKPALGWILTILCVICMLSMFVVLFESLPKWLRAARGQSAPIASSTAF